MTTKEHVLSVAESLGLSMSAKFVPWSQSRNADQKDPSLNWVVTISKDGREVLTTDYMAGCGHCPSYRQRATTDSARAVMRECETGHKAYATGQQGKPINPDFADVLYSLASDADAIDHATFEDWADMLGYDTDSRKAEGIYRACLEIGLKLRNALGDDGLTILREALQDY